MLQRDAIVGMRVTAQTTAGNPKRHTQVGQPVHEHRPTAQNGSTRTRAQAAGNGKKHPTRTGEAERKQHTAPNSAECNRIKSMRLHPETRERSKRALRPQPHRRRRAIDHGVAPTIQQHQRYNTYLAVGHCPTEPCTAQQLLGHPKS